MLDGFKKHHGRSAREQADDLEALIATSREERAALAMMLSQIQVHGAKLTAATRTLQEAEQRSAEVERRLDELMTRMTQVNNRTHDVEALEMRLRTLSDAVAAAEQSLESRVQTLNAEVAQLRTVVGAVAPAVTKEDERLPHDVEADMLRTRMEAVTVQVSDARRKLESVSAIQATLLPLTAQLTSLKSQIEKGEVRPPRLSS
jgi:chromosome segregation ATPase